jgi:antitoxin VapB
MSTSRPKSATVVKPEITDMDAWFAELDRFADVLVEGGRRQPPMPEAEDLFART